MSEKHRDFEVVEDGILIHASTNNLLFNLWYKAQLLISNERSCGTWLSPPTPYGLNHSALWWSFLRGLKLTPLEAKACHHYQIATSILIKSILLNVIIYHSLYPEVNSVCHQVIILILKLTSHVIMKIFITSSTPKRKGCSVHSNTRN